MRIVERVLKEVLSSWLEWELPEVIERDYPTEPSKNVIAIVGPRRAGKTYFLFQVAKRFLEKGFAKENLAYMDFEDIRLGALRSKDYGIFTKVLHELFREKEGKIVLLLDEIQSLQDWQEWVRTLHGTRRYYIYVSGSSSKLSIREISTGLRGRYVSRLVLPLSFREFLRFKNFSPKYTDVPEARGRMLSLLKEYLIFGGFPEVVMEEREERKVELLRTYRETIFYRDVVERFRVRNVSSLEAFLRIVMENFGKYLSLSKLERFFKSLGVRKSKRTLANYLGYLESAFFLFCVEKFGYKTKERVLQPRKVYPIDPGLCKLVPKFSEEIGLLMEMAVARELFRMRFFLPDFDFFYWKDYQGREVDFALKEGLRMKQLIQVSYISSPDESRKELEVLCDAARALRCRDLLVVTWDCEDQRRMRGKTVRFVPLWKWLLQRAGAPETPRFL